MIGFLLAYEGALRLSCFVAVLLIMLGWEQASPRRAPSTPRRARRLVNLSLVVIDAALLWLLLPAAAVGASLFAAKHSWGLFNTVAAPPWLGVLVTVIALDLAVWAQHVAMHKVGPLWRLHRVHHSDLDFDFTTGIRFHPLEILLSTIYKAIAVAALGAPVAAVIAFEILLNASSLFAHGNVRLPPTFDETIRRVVVTPDMHRVHHSVRRQELRLQPFRLGPSIRYLPRATARRPRRHVHRPPRVPGVARTTAGPSAAAAVAAGVGGPLHPKKSHDGTAQAA